MDFWGIYGGFWVCSQRSEPHTRSYYAKYPANFTRYEHKKQTGIYIPPEDQNIKNRPLRPIF